MAARKEILEVAGREVTISNPGKVFFPEAGHTKLDLVRYYLAVADGALRGVARPADGAEALRRTAPTGDFFFQKRAPTSRPDWIETVELSFPSGRTAEEIVVARRGAARLDREPRLHRPEPAPGARATTSTTPTSCASTSTRCRASRGRRSARSRMVAQRGARRVRPRRAGRRPRARAGSTSTCGIERRWTFTEVRRAALALAREVERRAPDLATSKWWKEERHGVFLDYNQNAKDRTVASAYSVRPTPDARVSTPLAGTRSRRSSPSDFTLDTVPARSPTLGDPAAGIDDAAGLARAAAGARRRARGGGLGDAPWPPHYAKQEGEPPRVQPSKRRRGTQKEGIVPPPRRGRRPARRAADGPKPA